jgi:two-component system, NarL family, response regulator DesR
MIRVLIAEDQRMLASALTSLLNLEPDIRVLDCVADGEAALARLRHGDIDVLLSDIEMPKMSGLELAARVKELGASDGGIGGCKVVIVTAFARAGFLRRALDAGVKAYLLKDAPSEKLADVIRTVHRGGRYIAPELLTDAWSEASPLSARERSVLVLAGEGLSSEEIGAKLHLSTGTVRNYLSEAIGKLDASNRIEAHRVARERGWL